MGAAANTLGAQASESTNAVSVHKRTNQTCCELRAVDMSWGEVSDRVANGRQHSRTPSPHNRPPTLAIPRAAAVPQKTLTF